MFQNESNVHKLCIKCEPDSEQESEPNSEQDSEPNSEQGYKQNS